jgi:hypothetical protein
MTQSIPVSELGGSSPAAKFTDVGDKHAGQVLDLKERQQTDIKGNLLSFSDGTPRMQWLITLEEPDGERVTLYAKGGNYRVASGHGRSMLAAIVEAITDAGADALSVGAQLAVQYTGRGVAQPNQDGAKLYVAQYQSPVATVPVADLFSP